MLSQVLLFGEAFATLGAVVQRGAGVLQHVLLQLELVAEHAAAGRAGEGERLLLVAQVEVALQCLSRLERDGAVLAVVRSLFVLLAVGVDVMLPCRAVAA